MRLPLSVPLESRDGTLAKDAKLKNSIVENIEGVLMVIKRPGISLNSRIVENGTAQGVFSLNGVPYAIADDTLIGLSQTQLPYVPPQATLTGSLGTVSLGAVGGGVGTGGFLSIFSLMNEASYDPEAAYEIDDSVVAQDPITGVLTTYYANSPQSNLAYPGASSTPSLLWRKTAVPTGELWRYPNTSIYGNSANACASAYLSGSFRDENPTAFVIYSGGGTGTLVYTIPGTDPQAGPFTEHNFSVPQPTRIL